MKNLLELPLLTMQKMNGKRFATNNTTNQDVDGKQGQELAVTGEQNVVVEKGVATAAVNGVAQTGANSAAVARTLASTAAPSVRAGDIVFNQQNLNNVNKERSFFIEIVLGAVDPCVVAAAAGACCVAHQWGVCVNGRWDQRRRGATKTPGAHRHHP